MAQKQPEHIDVVTYLTVEPRFHPRWEDAEGRPILDSGRVTSATAKRPERHTRSGSIVTKVTLRIDSAALLPLLPQAVIHISASDVEVIEVQAVDPAYPPDPETQP